MAAPMASYDPVMLVDIYLTDTYRAATKDIYIGLHDDYYKGSLIEFPSITVELSDTYYGVEQASSVTFQLANIDNGIDDTWDDIRDAEEIRGAGVRLRRHQLINEGVLVTQGEDAIITDDAGPYINHEILIEQFELIVYRGKVVSYVIDNITKITAEMRQDDVLETLLPLKTVTTDEFTDTAMDLGETINICIGHCRDVPLWNIQNNTMDDEYDYLIGYGTLENLDEDHGSGYGVRRDGVLVTLLEYTFYDGSQATPYPGYAFIRFTTEQMDFDGSYHNLTADVKGLEMGGASAQRNFAQVIRNLLSNATWGLNEAVDLMYFNAAADDLDTITNMYCDGSITEQRKASDIINDLLFIARGSIGKTDADEWWLKIDKVDSSVLALGDNDGYLNNAEIKDVSVVASDSAVKSATVEYEFFASEGSAQKELSLNVHTTFGIDKAYSLTFVVEDATAKKVLSYIYGRSIYSEKMVSVIAGMEARGLDRGNIITLTRPARNLAAEEFIVDRITYKAASFELECRSYDSKIHVDQAVASPTAAVSSTTVSAGPRSMPDLIVADPHIVDILWNNAGVLTVSAG